VAEVVIFVLGDARLDARVRREAAALNQAGYHVSIVGRPGDPASAQGDQELGDTGPILRVPVPGRLRRLLVRFGGTPRRSQARVARRSRTRREAQVTRGLRSFGRGLGWLVRMRFGALAWATAASRVAPRADVWHGADVPGLAAAAIARRERGGRLVYDAHEVYVEAGGSARHPQWAKDILERREWSLAASGDAIVTVNRAIAHELERRATEHHARVPRNAITVVHNCPPRYDPPADPVDHLRLAAGLAPGTPVALYHGGFSRGRGLEELAAAIREPGLEAVHAVFLGYGPLEPELRTWAADPASGDRLHVLPAVPPDELLDWITTADVAVVAIQPDTLNHRLSTPNKLFEAIAAGVPVVASDFAGIREIVADPTGPLGVLVDPTDPAAIAAAIRQLVSAPPAERAALRARCLAAAHERWNWETESAKLVELYGRLTAGTP